MSGSPPPDGRSAGFDTGHLGDRLSSLLDGELSAAEMAAAQRHLEGCAACADELDEVEGARQLLRGLDPPKPPETLVSGLLRRHRRLSLFLAALSVIAGITAALVFTLSSPREDVTPPVNRFERIHATSTPSPDPITEMAPVGVPTSAVP